MIEKKYTYGIKKKPSQTDQADLGEQWFLL